MSVWKSGSVSCAATSGGMLVYSPRISRTASGLSWAYAWAAHIASAKRRTTSGFSAAYRSEVK